MDNVRQKQAITRWLAEHVMGWEFIRHSNVHWMRFGTPEGERSFDPFIDANDALELLATQEYFSVDSAQHYCNTQIEDRERTVKAWAEDDDYTDGGIVSVFCRSICLAVARANGCPPEMLEGLCSLQ